MNAVTIGRRNGAVAESPVMGLLNYTYVATLGQSCTPTYQLMRKASALGMSTEQYSGPFDWFSTNLKDVTRTIRSSFLTFFEPSTTTIAGSAGETWKLKTLDGTESWHHLRRCQSHRDPGFDEWFHFGRWLGERVAWWQSAFANPKGRILLVRAEDPWSPDSHEEFEALMSLLRARSKAKIRLAVVHYSAHPGWGELRDVDHFVVAPTWPEGFTATEIDWERDYGWGVAWQGDYMTWDNLWDSL